MGIQNLQEIAFESDGIEIHRQFVSVNMPIGKLCPTQKKLIKFCNRIGKPVIVSGNIVGTMLTQPICSRSELRVVFFVFFVLFCFVFCGLCLFYASVSFCSCEKMRHFLFFLICGILKLKQLKCNL